MNLNTRSLIITSIIVFFVVILFLGFSTPAMHNLPDGYTSGRVLGVSEAMANRPFASLGYELPKNDYKPIVPPLKSEGTENIDLNIHSGAVLDSKTGTLIYGQEADYVQPIASITKLVTALVFLDTKPNWEEVYKMKASDRVDGGMIYLLTGEEVTVRDLFYLSLVGSANSATRALVSATGMTQKEFVAKMNKKVQSLGLKKTSFVDPVGLSDFNVSTAAEVTKIANEALKNKYIQEATLTKKYNFTTLAGRTNTAYNTDILLGIFSGDDIRIAGGKTGYTGMAGYCFVGKFINSEGNEVISAVLGGDTINSRFHETRNLINWTYNNFEWKQY
jgi:D-alanyl-D-alanine carboxypeptidase